MILLQVQNNLNIEDVFPRRYFSPSLNTMTYLSSNSMPVSEDIASRILCLPLHKELKKSILIEISLIINKNLVF